MPALFHEFDPQGNLNYAGSVPPDNALGGLKVLDVEGKERALMIWCREDDQATGLHYVRPVEEDGDGSGGYKVEETLAILRYGQSAEVPFLREQAVGQFTLIVHHIREGLDG